MKVIIAGVLQICVDVVLCKDPCEKYDVNGCNTPFKMEFGYRKRFTPACNRHDVCYSCGSMYHIPREVCDQYFLDAMKKSCNTLRKRRSTHDDHIAKRGFIRSVCKFLAKGFCKAVRIFAKKYYLKHSSAFCYKDKAWALSCMKKP